MGFWEQAGAAALSTVKSDSFWKGLGTVGQGFASYQNFKLGKEQLGMEREKWGLQKQDYERQRGYEENNRNLYFGG